MSLDDAEDIFRDFPSNKNAARYLRTLLEYEADDMIGHDTFLNGLDNICIYLDPTQVSN